jgi:dephospho-CoA kinase
VNTARVIGLTGEAGSGKSSVRRWLAARGVAELDADQVARTVLNDAAVRDSVILAFGPGVRSATEGIDRKALARLVFSDPLALEALERIVHPGVLEATRAWLREEQNPLRVVEAIKLVESGMKVEVDEVWLVVCARAERQRRLLARGWSEAEVRRRLRAGRGFAAHLADCDLVIDNSGDWKATEVQLAAAWRRRLACVATKVREFEGAARRGEGKEAT